MEASIIQRIWAMASVSAFNIILVVEGVKRLASKAHRPITGWNVIGLFVVVTILSGYIESTPLSNWLFLWLLVTRILAAFGLYAFVSRFLRALAQRK